MYNWLPALLANGETVLQSAHHVGHLGKLVEVLQLAQHIDSLLHQLEVILRHRHVHDAVVRVAIPIIFIVIYLYGGIVAQFVRPHHLKVALHGAQTHSLTDTLHIV